MVDGTFGLYLGWVAVATCANITAAAVSSGIGFGPIADQVVGVVIILVAAGLGVLLAVRLGGRIAVAAALAWGLGWIAVGRLAEGPISVAVGVAAVVAAGVVLAATAAVRKGGRARVVAAPTN